MVRILKALAWLVFVVVTAIGAAAVWYRSVSQPQIDGRLQLQGLKAAVDIVRDAEDIPHIYAQSAEDAYFALGFVHAQDRLWQLDMNRRIAAGRLAEVLGPNAVGADRFLRTLGVYRNAQAIVEHLAPESRAALDAYARGINAYLARRSGPLPVEFLLTGAPQPEPWQAADSLAWQTMMAWDLSGNWTQELLRMRLSQRLSLSQINQFLAPYPGDAPVKTMDYTGLYRSLAGTAQQLSKVAQAAPPSLVQGKGSNNWVVSGALSETGKPLLANDPHLSLSMPSIWYLAHLSAPGLNVIGGTLPGIPSVVLGHNDRIAWGFTNTGPDVQDLYIERIRPDDPGRYQTPNGWAAFSVRKEIIKVKGEPDVAIEVRASRHGPVISGALPLADKAPLDAKRYVIAFAWTALRADDLTFQAAYKLNRAGNWREFLDAARDFGSPQQNIVYADIDGNIGFIAPARVPIRKPDNDLMGLAPAPGWDSRYDWDGFIPFDALPRQFNPASQRVVTANEKIVGPDYPYFLTSEWDAPYRANRIKNLLAAQEKHSMNSFALIQKDVVSLAAQELLPVLRQTVPRSQRARLALAALASWNGAMEANRIEPLLFAAWMRAASRRMFSDELGEDLMNDYWTQRNVHFPMARALQNVEGQSVWCRNVTATKAEPQSCADLLSVSLEEALADLERRYGADMTAWKWGDAHVAHAEHRPLGKVPVLSKLFDIRIPTPGDSYTVNAGRYNFRDEEQPFASRHAASLRAIYDLADLENSRFIDSSGQAGNFLSPYYRNYAERWAEVKYLPMKTRRETVEQGKTGTLTLVP